MSIYNDVFLIDEQLRTLQESADATEDISQREEILQQAREVVINNGLETLCKVRQNRRAEIDAIKAEEDRLKAKRKSLENSTDWLENYISDVFKLSGKTKETYGTFTLSFRKSTQCKIDETKFHDERFQTIMEVKKIDTMGVKEALKNGEIIEGAELVENQNLQIK